MKYLHTSGDGIYHLDHRLTPEVRAMFASMTSRLPEGGIQKRYKEVVYAVAEGLVEEDFQKYSPERMEQTTRFLKEDHGKSYREVMVLGRVDQAEERLTTYPLHPAVQRFFDQFVGQYGHSSIMELTGSPTVGVEGVSWFTAWLLFDSPLVAGQEFSTRALRHKDWPMARESYVVDIPATSILQAEDERILRELEPDIDLTGFESPPITVPHPELANLHDDWLAVYDAEVEWWKGHLSDPANRAALGIGDKEPFRPALDRARWALPGSIATGAAFASHLRERSRAIRDAKSINKTPTPVWANLEAAYRQAAPGLAHYGLREAVVGDTRDLPGHLASILRPVGALSEPSGVVVRLQPVSVDAEVQPYARSQERSYLDPWFNHLARASIQIECSLAVARDWHRHRTLYPWHLGVVLSDDVISLDRRYEPKSELGRAKLTELLRRSTALYLRFLHAGDVERAALALPLGTKVVVSASGGLRDVVYMLELRAHAHGANFEYKEQAEAALHHLEVRTRLAFMSLDSDESLYSGSGFHPGVRGR